MLFEELGQVKPELPKPGTFRVGGHFLTVFFNT